MVYRDLVRLFEIPGLQLRGHPSRRPPTHAKMLGLLALVFAWTYQTGDLLTAKQPILLKKHSNAPSNPSSGTDSISSAAASST